ncbi:protein PROCA1 [Sceloporus undulatus]|uniref:protein PROCA1 n=1 Tax=Sceloporus undulatus TaxID=8520 RepID=UPI001C4DC42F|nr:protein PROCA1 [Sceloporus undulatus]
MLCCAQAPFGILCLAGLCVLLEAGGPGFLCTLLWDPQGPSFQTSDGEQLLSATWAPLQGPSLRQCHLSSHPAQVRAFLSRCQAGGETEGSLSPFPSLKDAQAACLDGLALAEDAPPAWRHRRAKRGFTYPGTFWCGAGNIAGSYEELGEHRETDRCCREHDHCQHVIHPFTYKYGYRNLRWHTISHCDCDNRLKACLRGVNDTASRVVGQAFFNVIQVPCFQFTYKEQCIEPYLYVWCKNYSTVAVAVVQEPVLYEYGGEVIDGPAAHRPSVTTPTVATAAPAHKPGMKPVAAITKAPALPGRPGSPGKKHRPGKGKKRKGKKGKGLKKKKMEDKAGALPVPIGDVATVSPKRLAAQDLGKTSFQGPDLGEEDPFNAILGDDPGEGVGLRFDPNGAWLERKEEIPPNPGIPSTAGPLRKKWKGRRRTSATKEQPSLLRPTPS